MLHACRYPTLLKICVFSALFLPPLPILADDASPNARKIRGVLAGLDDPEESVRRLALKRIAEFETPYLTLEMRPYADEILNILGDETNSDELRAEALRAFRSLGTSGREELPVIEPFVRHPSHRIRAEALRTIGSFRLRENLDELLGVAEDDRTPAVVRIAALQGIAYYPAEMFAGLWPRLFPLVTAGHAELRAGATALLERLQSKVPEIAPEIARALRKDTGATNLAPVLELITKVARTLATTGALSPESNQRIVDLALSQQGDPAVRVGALRAAAALGLLSADQLGEAEVGSIARLALDPTIDAAIRVDALRAVGDLELSSRIIGSLRELLSDPLRDLGGRVRAQALRIVTGDHEDAEVYLPEILAMVDDPVVRQTELRSAMAQAFWKSGELAERYLPRILSIVEEGASKDQGDRGEALRIAKAVEILGKNAATARRHVRKLGALLDFEDPMGVVRAATIQAIVDSNLKSTFAPKIRDLLELGDDSDPLGLVRMAALEAIGSSPSVPESLLIELLQTPHEEIYDRTYSLLVRREAPCTPRELCMILSPLHGDYPYSTVDVSISSLETISAADKWFLVYYCGDDPEISHIVLGLFGNRGFMGRGNDVNDFLETTSRHRTAFHLLVGLISFPFEAPTDNEEPADPEGLQRTPAEERLRRQIVYYLPEVAEGLSNWRRKDLEALKRATKLLSENFGEEAEQLRELERQVEVSWLSLFWGLIKEQTLQIFSTVMPWVIGLVLVLVILILMDRIVDWWPNSWIARVLRLLYEFSRKIPYVGRLVEFAGYLIHGFKNKNRQ